jgi:hypothetical protein
MILTTMEGRADRRPKRATERRPAGGAVPHEDRATDGADQAREVLSHEWGPGLGRHHASRPQGAQPRGLQELQRVRVELAGGV